MKAVVKLPSVYSYVSVLLDVLAVHFSAAGELNRGAKGKRTPHHPPPLQIPSKRLN